MINHISTDTFKEEVLGYKGQVILDFYADWCGPCKAQGRILENFSEKHPDVKICKCNVDENDELAAEFGVQTIPTLVFFRDGEKRSQISSVMQEPSLLRLLEN